MISHSTPAGMRPASRQRSTTASVCPARRRTPPSSARSGKMWPGRARSAGTVARIRERPDRRRPVCGGDPRGRAVDVVHRHREGRFVERRVRVRPSAPAARARARGPSSGAQMMPPPVRREEIDDRRRPRTPPRTRSPPRSPGPRRPRRSASAPAESSIGLLDRVEPVSRVTVPRSLRSRLLLFLRSCSPSRKTAA